MTLSTGMARASPIDDERQPETSDPSAYYDEPADRTGGAERHPDHAGGQRRFLRFAGRGQRHARHRTSGKRLPPARADQFQLPHQWQAEPVVRCAAIHPAVVAVRRVRPGKTRPTTPAAPLPFPPAAIGPLPAQDPNSVARSAHQPALDTFLKQPGLTPFPTQFSNVVDRNPWQAQIEVLPQPPHRFVR
jgi:hypothetical protein